MRFSGRSDENSVSVATDSSHRVIRDFCPRFERSQKSLANQSQILDEASIGRGNQCPYKKSRSHDQDGCHAHMW